MFLAPGGCVCMLEVRGTMAVARTHDTLRAAGVVHYVQV